MNKRGLCTIFVLVNLMAFGIIGCDYLKGIWKKAEKQGCKGIVALAEQGKKQLVSRYDAKRPQCVDELPVIRKCIATGEYVSAKGAEVEICEQVADEVAKMLAKEVAKRCEANEAKLYKDIKNMKELCAALIALGFFK